MAKKTTKTDASTHEADKDSAPAKPARRTVAKLAGSVKKKIKSVLESKPPKTKEGEPAAPTPSADTIPGKLKAREARTTAPRKTARTAARSKQDLRGGEVGFTSDDIALRAYFLAQHRVENGKPGTPEEDWIEAERQLAVEKGQSLVHSR